jgi:Uma2 family endonuclease
MAALPDLITVEQFRQLPESGEHSYELHHGKVIAMTRPKAGHFMQQVRFVDLLQPKLSGFGRVVMEFPYRPVPEFELRAADVALVSHERWNGMDRQDNLRGAPELVIEMISPSNTRNRLRDTVSLCLANGAQECWLVDLKRKSITVVRRDGTTSLYEGDTEIPLTAFGSDSLRLADIFE